MHESLSSRKRIDSRPDYEPGMGLSVLGMGLYVVAGSLDVRVSDRLYVRLLDGAIGMTTRRNMKS